MCHGRIIPETWGGVLIKGLWESQTEAIIYVRFGDTDIYTYNKEVMDTLLPRWEKMKKYKNRQQYHKQRKHFLPFVLSVDGMSGKEAQDLIATFSWIVEVKIEEPIFNVKGWFNGLVTISVARSYPRTLQGSWIPIPLQTREPDWNSGSGLGLAQ